MLENAKGKGRKKSGKTLDGSGLPAEDAAGLSPPAAVAAARDAYGGPMQSKTRQQQIELAAYYKAQQRSFQGGSPVDDWLAAEREFDGAYLARGMEQQE